MVNNFIYISAISAVILGLVGCGGRNPADVYRKTGREALLIVVENNNLLDSMLEAGYALYHDEVKSILADVFQIDEKSISDTISLAQIVDRFGEDWQIRKLEDAARPYYSRIASLTDAAASCRTILDTLSAFAGGGFTIDMVINLHGGMNWLSGSTSIYFSDGSRNVNAFADSIRNRSISLRALYATCCYGAYMIPSWEKTGIAAVNGASDVNYFVMFSPIYFLEKWTKGMPYRDAVETAFNSEIEKIRSYRAKLPAISMLLTDDVVESSSQQFGGTNPLLLFAGDD